MRYRVRGAILGVLLLVVLAACDSAPVPSPTVATVVPGMPVPSATSAVAAAPSPTPPAAPASPTQDSAAVSAYATITAISRNDAATVTALAKPTVTPPTQAAPAVPASALGTYRTIITAKAEGYRVYQQPGTLVLSAAAPGSGHSAEIRISAGVRSRHELADLSPGRTVGAIFLATLPDLLPPGFSFPANSAPRVVYDPATKFLAITADPKYGIPGGWSTGPNNKAGKPRPITGGTITLDLGNPGRLSGQLDLTSTAAPAPVMYSGGLLGTK